MIHDKSNLTLVELVILDKQQKIAEVGVEPDIAKQLAIKAQIERERRICAFILDARGGWYSSVG